MKANALNKLKPNANVESNREHTTDDKDKLIVELQNKINELESKLQSTKTHADDFNLKDELTEYSTKRMTTGLISDTATRATFIVDDEVLERLDNFTNYIEASNSSNSSYNPNNKSEEVLRRERAMAKGIKSKLLSLAIKKALDEWEQIEHIPETKKVRYPVQVQKERGKGTKKEWHRAYMFTHEGITYGIAMDGRSNQLEYLTTDTEVVDAGDGIIRYNLSKDDIIEWFNKKEEQAQLK